MTFELRGIANLSDEDRMKELINYVKIQVDDEDDPLAIAANISAFIMATTREINWAGFYFLRNDELVLGPFQGLPACTRLTLDKGVCAHAFRTNQVTRVDDVHAFDGHIACDSNTNSELVIPLVYKGKVYGVLDIDSPKLNRFGNLEVDTFTELGKIIEEKVYLL